MLSIMGMLLFANCEPTNLADEDIEFHSTDKKDSVNSGGGTNPPVNNDEE
ncbi:hypothetical protein KAOT1_19107 [Kordia algicida OT-1]|uniref:Uncharacterized protein n=2 Tax=Kordia TaxID=221065 RepID=A9DNX2_9FLAO|nr:hypothetical protein KAOT1_19107 [Kordia algicida OT-1]